ncbi:hypothetical protein ACFWRZ_09125 [Streptomyces rubiginosohelvolus]|uniref:hypothetical protein n=1 Tax=Streptomyces rubiginosohelvolus TaxID=67362 RepID=UPI003663C027
MSTPGVLATLTTKPRRDAQRAAEKRRLADLRAWTSSELATARATLNTLRTKADGVRREGAERRALRSLYPQTIPILPTEDSGLADALALASAHGAAARVAHESAELEYAGLRRRTAKENAGGRAAAELAHGRRDVVAPGYVVAQLWQDGTGSSMDPYDTWTVSKTRARSLIGAWMKAPNGWVLRDTDDRLFVATPTMVLELVPTDTAAPHTEGDALIAALAEYNLPALLDTEGGFTWIAVPLNPEHSVDDAYTGPHVRISSGERADRTASRHDEVWGASVYGANAEYVDTLDPAPAGSSLAEDSALCASRIAAYAARLFQR